MAKKEVLDFTNTREGGGQFTKKRMPAGDYAAKVTKFEVTEIKKGDNKGDKQWLYTIAIDGRHGASYPYYCQLHEAALWKVRNLLVAAGKTVPKKKLAVDPEIVVGKRIGITLDDAEYEGRDQSEITAVFPASEIDDTTVADDDDDDDDDDDGDEEEAPKQSKKKAVVEDDDDADDADEEPAPKKSKKDKKKKKKAAAADDDDDLDELAVEDI